MGGRGASVGNSIPTDNRHWAQIDPYLTGENEIDGIRILYCTDTTKAKLPTESNTANTTYIIADPAGLIAYIGVYENHKVVRTVDISEGGTYHQHTSWEDGMRKSHRDQSEVDDPKLRALADKCVAYNIRHFGLKVLKQPKKNKQQSPAGQQNGNGK